MKTCRGANGDIHGLLSITASVGHPVCETCAAKGYLAIKVTRTRGGDDAHRTPVPRFGLGAERLTTFLETEPTGPVKTASDDTQVWPVLLQALGQGSSDHPAPKLVRVPGWKLTVRPRAGEDPAEFSVSWQVKERSAAGGPGTTTEVVRTLVGEERDGLRGAEITLEFPPGDPGVHELVVKAELTHDRKLDAGAIVWHAFNYGGHNVDRDRVEGTDLLLRVAAGLAGVDPPEFLALTRKPPDNGAVAPIAAVVGRRARSTLYDIRKAGVVSLEDIRWLTCEARKSQMPELPNCDRDEIEKQLTRSWNGRLRVDDCCIARLTTFPESH